MEPPAQVVYGGEHCVPDSHSHHQELPPLAYEPSETQGVRTLSEEPYQGVCIQVHLCASKMDMDGKTMDDEHIHTEYGIQESVLLQ